MKKNKNLNIYKIGTIWAEITDKPVGAHWERAMQKSLKNQERATKDLGKNQELVEKIIKKILSKINDILNKE